ncbi:glycosyltransferase family protein [Streptomyces sioyaensis]|uniref:glycosyltransferase family protein n=1 Tax=Streptomyces sioyaensis TaxID=67364 RepID=UPI003F54144E
MLRQACGRPVQYVPHVAPLHLLTPTREAQQNPVGVTLIGKRLTYFGIELLPNDRERATLVRGLQALGENLSIYGRGWRGPHAHGPVPFSEQLRLMQSSLITVGWDRYREHFGYFSDRLPIAMCAGRVHVTSRQPGLEWLPGPDQGLHLAQTPREAVELVRVLMDSDPSELVARANEMSQWARTRLTETQALLYMLCKYLPLPRPPAVPWDLLSEGDFLELFGGG